MRFDSPGASDGHERSIPRRRAYWGAVVLVLATALLTVGATGFIYEQRLQRLELLQRLEQADNIGRLLTVIQLAEQEYVDEVDLERLVDGAAAGAIEALGDPYSVYFDPQEFQEFEINLTGEYEGIGVVVTERGEYVTVQTPFPGSPGATTPPLEAPPGTPPGLRPGDKLVEIDGQSVVGVPVSEAAKLIRGPEGTKVQLTVLRAGADGAEQTLRFAIERARIEIPTVTANLLEPGIGYIWLTMFAPTTPDDFKNALADLRAQGMRALILDLRNNPGGELGASVEVAAQLLPEGPVVHVVRRNGEREIFSAPGSNFALPLVVLVNGASASASEIVAGAIQDYGVGVLVGETTFGKGSVQTVWRLDENGITHRRPQGDVAGVKITTAKYLTPKGRSIHGTGIEPDVVVEQPGTAQFGVPEQDPQLQKALEIARERLGS